MEQKTRHSGADAEWLAFSLAADYGVDLACVASKRLIGDELYRYVASRLMMRGKEPTIKELYQYLDDWKKSYGWQP